MPGENALSQERIKQIQEVLNLKALEQRAESTQTALESFIEKASGELKDAGKVSTETKAAVDSLTETAVKLGDQLKELEQRLDAVGELGGDEESKSVGEQFIESDQWKDMIEGRARTASREYEESLFERKTAIVNATGQNQPLVPADRRPGIIHEPQRILRLRDFLPVTTTNSNLVEFAKENVFTNAAAVVVGGSPTVSAENVTKPESGITFTLSTAEVKTIAHWIPASKQVLSDSPMLSGHIDMRLLYGLKLKEETQLLTGDGTLGTFLGLTATGGHTDYAPVSSPKPATVASKIDQIRDAKRQAAQAEYDPDLVILNTNDWSEIELTKESTGGYIVGRPFGGLLTPPLWGMNVLVTNSMTAGSFIVMSSMSCQIVDREQSSIEVSRENSDNFVKNMVTILAEERLAFPIYRPAGIIYGSFF